MKKQRDMSVDAKIGLGERLTYTIGGGGINMSMAVLGLLLTYYTMVLGINAGTAAMIIGISKLLDGVSDLVMGHIVDHTNTRFGKARPWLLRMAIPTAVATVATFAVPTAWDTTAKIIYMFITYNLSNTICYTALAVPFNALNGYMTTNQKSRGVNGGFIMIINALTNTVVNATYLGILRAFGGGEVYSPRGWTLTMLLFAVVSAAMTLIGFFGTRERASSSDADTEQEKSKPKVSVGRSVKALLTNRYWIICIVVMLVVFILSALLASSNIYFAQFVLNDVNQQPIMTIALSLSLIPAAIISIALMGKFGKRNMMLVGLIFFALSSLLPLLGLNALMSTISMALKGVGLGLASAPTYSIVLDALTYGEWKNGFSNMGLGNAANSFSGKLGTSLGTIILGGLLEVSGFVSGASVQPESAVTMIGNIFIWVPFIFAVICIVVLLFYNLDKFYPQVVADLKEGKYAPGVEPIDKGTPE